MQPKKASVTSVAVFTFVVYHFCANRTKSMQFFSLLDFKTRNHASL